MGSWNRKSQDLNGKTADLGEKTIAGSGKIAGETRAQSPKSNWSIGGDPLSENNTKKINIFNVILFSQQVREKIVGGFHDECSFEFLLMSVP